VNEAIARCPCGDKANLRTAPTNWAWVECENNHSGKIGQCWSGPVRLTKWEAIRDWNRVAIPIEHPQEPK
jgi:hypothetical protein